MKCTKREMNEIEMCKIRNAVDRNHKQTNKQIHQWRAAQLCRVFVFKYATRNEASHY